MEQVNDWLAILMNKAHLYFLAGLWVTLRHKNSREEIKTEALGDNFPVFALR